MSTCTRAPKAEARVPGPATSVGQDPSRVQGPAHASTRGAPRDYPVETHHELACHYHELLLPAAWKKNSRTRDPLRLLWSPKGRGARGRRHDTELRLFVVGAPPERGEATFLPTIE